MRNGSLVASPLDSGYIPLLRKALSQRLRTQQNCIPTAICLLWWKRPPEYWVISLVQVWAVLQIVPLWGSFDALGIRWPPYGPRFTVLPVYLWISGASFLHLSSLICAWESTHLTRYKKTKWKGRPVIKHQIQNEQTDTHIGGSLGTDCKLHLGCYTVLLCLWALPSSEPGPSSEGYLKDPWYQ